MINNIIRMKNEQIRMTVHCCIVSVHKFFSNVLPFVEMLHIINSPSFTISAFIFHRFSVYRSVSAFCVSFQRLPFSVLRFVTAFTGQRFAFRLRSVCVSFAFRLRSVCVSFAFRLRSVCQD